MERAQNIFLSNRNESSFNDIKILACYKHCFCFILETNHCCNLPLFAGWLEDDFVVIVFVSFWVFLTSWSSPVIKSREKEREKIKSYCQLMRQSLRIVITFINNVIINVEVIAWNQLSQVSFWEQSCLFFLYFFIMPKKEL